MVEDCEASSGKNGQRDKELLEDKDSETRESVVGEYDDHHCSGNSQSSGMTTTDQGSSGKAVDMAESFSPATTVFNVVEQSNENYWNVEDLWPVNLLNGDQHVI